MQCFWKINEVYTTQDGKKCANPEEHYEGWMQISRTMRRKVTATLISGPSHNPLRGWKFEQC